MAVWPEGAARLRRARNLLGYCLACPPHLFLGLGLGAIGLVLLGAGAGAQQCICRGLGWGVDSSDHKWMLGTPRLASIFS